MQEYFIRKTESDEARGPFGLEQISSLVEAGQVDKETLLFDPKTDKWSAIADNEEAYKALFPEKKRLRVKAKESIDRLNVESEDDAPITVDEMLAAAEGKTGETREKGRIKVRRERAAAMSLPTAALILLLSAAALIAPHVADLAGGDPAQIATNPFLVLGAIDVVLALLLLLQMSSLFPLVRFRAMVGLGFLLMYFWAFGETETLLAVTAGSISLFLCTILLNFWAMVVTALVGLAGMGYFLYVQLVL